MYLELETPQNHGETHNINRQGFEKTRRSQYPSCFSPKKAGPNRNGGLTCLLQRWVVSNLIGGQAYGPSNQVVVSCFCGRKLVEMIRDYSLLTYFATGLQLTKQQKGSGHKTALNISLEMVHQPCTTAASLSFSRSVNA